MARPKTQTVDYFPHSCNNGKTIFILEQKFGNNGYAFWFKLLERLGKTEGHYLNLTDDVEFLFLCSITRLESDNCIEILDLLASIEAIDKELWQTNKTVWCQHFVDGLEDLYSRRKVDKPIRENAVSLKVISSEEISEDEKKKIWCRNLVNRGVKSGKISKQPCRICNTTNDLQAHHFDYDNPLDVIWLCQNHHLMLHNNQINGINVYSLPSEWDKLYNNVYINPQSKVKESKEEEKESKVNTAVSPVAPVQKKKRASKKKPDAEPYWGELIKVYFSFCFEKFNEKPSFTGSDPSDMHRIIESLKKRAAEQNVEWTEETAKLRWREFLGRAFQDDWLSQNWLLPHLNRQKNKIFLNLVGKKNGTHQQQIATIGKTIEFD
jgi:hypothetical protein